MQELYENFLDERFCNRLKYSNRAVNFANHTKYFYTNCKNKQKAKYGTSTVLQLQICNNKDINNNWCALRIAK